MDSEHTHGIRRLFGWSNKLSVGFYVTDFLFRRILRQNADVKWPVHHTATIRVPEKIVKGKEVFPGDSPGVYINAVNGIHIGDYTNIGPNVCIVSANHDLVNNDVHLSSGPVVIGRFCWLGFGAVVLPEVQLGDFTIIGANAVVTKSYTDGYCVLAGNPAKVVRYLNKEECDAFAKSKN